MTTDSTTVDPAQPLPFIYGYVGARTHPVSEDRAEGTLHLRADLRGPHGPRAAALAVLVQDLSAGTVGRYASVVPILINVQIRRSASAVEELFARGSTLRRGRSVMATEVHLSDAAEPESVVAFGTASWAVMGTATDTPRPPRPGPGTPAGDDIDPSGGFHSMLEAIGAVPLGDGRGYQLAGVEAEHGQPAGPQAETLHVGALQVLAEGAATLVAEQRMAGAELMIETLTTHFLAPVRTGRITAVAEILTVGDGGLDCRVEVRDQAGEGRLSSLALARFAVVS